jgi:hypothetical protein
MALALQVRPVDETHPAAPRRFEPFTLSLNKYVMSLGLLT